MTWNPVGSPQRLFEAIRRLDRPEVARLCEQLIAHVRGRDAAYPALGAADILRALRRKRHFRLLQQVADAFIQSGLDDPVIRRQYAQSLIDEGYLTAAVSVLGPLSAATIETDPYEHCEVNGLLGRALKQMYVAADTATTARRHLREAVRAYHDVYTRSPTALWHGINVVALLDRAARDGLPVDGFPAPRDRARTMASQILDDVTGMGERAQTWDRATAVEACVALDRPDEALAWLGSYVQAPDADAFELASTLRQLTQVWQLSPDREPGARLLPLLQAALLRREGGEVEVGAVDVEQPALDRMDRGAGLEKIFGTDRFSSLAWFRDALERCRAVARIEDRHQGGVGTGFLVPGASLHRSLPETVLVTNAHVLGDAASPAGKDPQALDREQALVTFRALGSSPGVPAVHRVASVEWSSLPHQLDATIATVDGLPAGVTRCPVAARRPLLEGGRPPQTYIIGHPRGGEQPMFSIRDNLLLDADDTRLHYRTPTLEGSSGSPVFNASWELIAIHHAGRAHMPRLHGRTGTYAANEGIWIDRIRDELNLPG